MPKLKFKSWTDSNKDTHIKIITHRVYILAKFSNFLHFSGFQSKRLRKSVCHDYQISGFLKRSKFFYKYRAHGIIPRIEKQAFARKLFITSIINVLNSISIKSKTVFTLLSKYSPWNLYSHAMKCKLANLLIQ